MRRLTSDDFWAKVDKQGSDDCWLWKGSAFVNGYGQVGSRIQAETRAHRLAWHITNGPIPAGIVVCHSCDTPLCCNPAHLFLGTSQDNVNDKCNKGRQARGEKQHLARTTIEAVLEIRRTYKPRCPEFGRKALAARFNLSEFTVGDILSRHTWKHV